MITLPLTFAETYPGGRILLMLGQHQIGAVFPPAGHPQVGIGPWCWRFWISTYGNVLPEGHAKTEQAAKNALLAEARDWLRKAGLQA
jgi:hypothetical protein